MPKQKQKHITDAFNTYNILSNSKGPMYRLIWTLIVLTYHTVEPQWLEHLWDHGNSFETWVVRATED